MNRKGFHWKAAPRFQRLRADSESCWLRCTRCWAVVNIDCLSHVVVGDKGLCCYSLDRLAISQSKASLPAVCSLRTSPAPCRGGCFLPQTSGSSVDWIFGGPVWFAGVQPSLVWQVRLCHGWGESRSNGDVEVRWTLRTDGTRRHKAVELRTDVQQ